MERKQRTSKATATARRKEKASHRPGVAVGLPLLALQRAIGNREVVRQLQIQRKVERVDPDERQDFNLAKTILDGGANGLTPPLLNGKEIPIVQGTRRAAADAIRRPKISTKREGWVSGDYVATVTEVPTNTVGARVYYPTDPPWVVPAGDPARVAMVALGGGFKGVNKGTVPVDVLDRRRGTTKFTAKGESGDAQFLEAIRVHELHHADDHWRAAEATLRPWDLALEDQLKSKQTHKGPTAAAANAAVYREAGGTPDDIAGKLDTLWVQLDADFHATHEGRRSDIQSYSINADGSEATGWFDY